MKFLEKIKPSETILIISVLYSIIMGVGLFGFGTDYHSSYYKSNYNYSTWSRDLLGWRISTFTIFNYHLGVYLTSFILAFSTGKLIFFFFKSNRISSILIFSIIYLIAIFTWPIFQSTSNAMRQGLAMSFFNLSICTLMENKNRQSIIYIIIAYFSHTTGLFLFLIYGLSRFCNFFSIKNKLLFFWAISLIIFTLIFFNLFYGQHEKNRIIGYDFGLVFLLINFFIIFFLSYKIKYITNNIFYIISFFTSFFSPTLFFLDMLWQFERLNMMFILTNILVIGSFYKKKQTIFIWFTGFLILLFLTYLTGMFRSFT